MIRLTASSRQQLELDLLTKSPQPFETHRPDSVRGECTTLPPMEKPTDISTAQAADANRRSSSINPNRVGDNHAQLRQCETVAYATLLGVTGRVFEHHRLDISPHAL